MQGQVVDVVLLLLLILFFGLQQSGRPQIYFRFWFVGWIFVFLGYLVWVVKATSPRMLNVQNAADFDFLLLGALTFLMSLLAERPGLLKMVMAGSLIGVANVIVIDIHEFKYVPRVVLFLVVLLWQGLGFYTANKLLPREWTRRRAAIFAVCVTYGAALLLYIATTRARDLDNLAVIEVLLCTAVLYMGRVGRRSIAGWLGTVGFATWALLYFINILPDTPAAMQAVLYEFWNFPKYFVGCSMILKVFEDVSDEKTQMANKFRELYDDFRLIYESHPHPMWICDAVSGEFLTANVAALKVYGYSIEELLEMRMAEFDSPMDRERDAMESALAAPAEGTRTQHRHKDGCVVWVNIVDREIMYMGREARFVIARDITERLKLDEELSHRAHHDALTGLPNRKLMEDRLQQSLKACERDEKKAALLTIDVDHFKLINDTYGHLVGDECLKEVAARLKSKIRKVDTIARTGGEEFMAIVGGLSNATDAEKVARALLSVFEAPVVLAFGELGVKVSIGVAVFPDDGTDAETLRRLSDQALYAAKRGGRNRAAYAYDAEESVVERF